MAARWSRAETTVTRVLLLAVFCVGLVAQFVKPVGDARSSQRTTVALGTLLGRAVAQVRLQADRGDATAA
jgi:hypothetical protein